MTGQTYDTVKHSLLCMVPTPTESRIEDEAKLLSAPYCQLQQQDSHALGYVGTSHQGSQLQGRHLSAWEAEWPAGRLASAGLVLGALPWLQGLCCLGLAQ